MARLAPGLFGLALLALWVWAVLDVIATDRVLIRTLNKIAWLFLVIFFPTIGAVGWITFGRPTGARVRPGATTAPPQHKQRRPAPRGLEDTEYWSAMTTQSTPQASDGFETTAAKERRLREQEAEANRDPQLEEETETDPPV